MTIRAVIFDVYGTLLRVGPPPADADERWQNLLRSTFRTGFQAGRLEFSIACAQAVAKRHAIARARGIVYPEILWPSVVAEVLPEFSRLKAEAQEEFLFRHIQTGHTTTLDAGAADVLRFLPTNGCLLGIASNAQAYSIRELNEGLAEAGLEMGLFDPGICFWSFRHGFSKPDPCVFQILTSRLEALGVPERATLMVGDHLDNDIRPARAHGWQTWRITDKAGATGRHEGDWRQLALWLRGAIHQ